MIQNMPEYLPSDVLKIGHHGSQTSTSQEFLQTVEPDAAVIQVGEDNRYGHPHDEVLQRLQDHDVDIYRNDYQGDIAMTFDGNTCDTNVDPWDGQIDYDDEINYTTDPETPEKPETPEEPETPVVSVDVNTAPKEDLMEIVHIGESRAEEIIELRPFDSSIDQG